VRPISSKSTGPIFAKFLRVDRTVAVHDQSEISFSSSRDNALDEYFCVSFLFLVVCLRVCFLFLPERRIKMYIIPWKEIFVSFIHKTEFQ